MRAILILSTVLLTGCNTVVENKVQQELMLVMQQSACVLGYVSALSDNKEVLKFDSKSEVLITAEGSCRNAIYKSHKKDVILQSVPTVEIVDSKDDTNTSFVVVGDCRVEVKKTELKNYNAVLTKVDKVCRLGLVREVK